MGISVNDIIIDESRGVAIVTVMNTPSASIVTVNYATAGFTAGGSDFGSVSGLLTFAPGQTMVTVEIPILDDTGAEGLEHFRFNLSLPTNAAIDRASALVTIVDNDTVVAVPRLSVRDVVVDEKAGIATFVVSLDELQGHRSNLTISVDYSTADDTAVSGSDYVGQNGTLVFAPGETVKTVSVNITDDALAEGVERFNLLLSNAVNATIADAQGIAEIGANDSVPIAQPRISVADRFVGESEGYVDVVVSLSAPGQSPVSVAYTTAGVTAGGSDYAAVSGTLNFAIGETTKTVRVQLYEDGGAEGLEHFRFNLSAPTNATIGNASAMISIADNDPVVDTPMLFVRDVVVDEKAGTATFAVLLGGPSGQSSNSTVTVNYATGNDSALAGSDYIAKNGTLVFAPGESVKTVVVDISDDAVAEGLERFTLTLSNAVNATIADAQGIAEIGANDGAAVAPPRISVSDRLAAEGDGYVDVALSLSAPSLSNISVTYATQGVTAGGSDFVGVSGSLTFAAGETTKVVRIDLYEDSGVEALETFRLNLSNPVNAVLNSTFATITLVDNDASGIAVLSYGRSNDVYTVTSPSDVIVEEADGGVDSVFAGVNYVLGANVENLTLTGLDATTATGNALANTLIGNSLANTFNGGAGNDTLIGGAGIDIAVFSGSAASYSVARSAGGVVVTGGDGQDTLFGVERLVFNDGSVVVSAPRQDLSGDGVADLLWRNIANGANVIWQSANNAAGIAVTPVGDTSNWRIMGVADFSGDGVSDVLWRQGTSGTNVIWRNADSAQSEAVTAVPDPGWKVVGVGDFNGDAKADILWRNAFAAVNVIWRNGDSANAQALTSVPGFDWKVAGVGDFNGDGRADIFWRNASVGANVLWNGGDSTQGVGVAPVYGNDWRVAGVGDFNGDQVDDVLWRNGVTGDNVVWRSADNTQAQSIATVADRNWTVAAVQDYDGDTVSDILWRNTSTGDNVIWRSADIGSVRAVGTTDANWVVQSQTGTWSDTLPHAKFDFDGDGKSDLLWRNTASGANAIWRSANADSGIAVTSVADTGWKVAAVADFDGNGKADLLWRNVAAGVNVIWKDGNAATADAVAGAATAWKVAGAGDFDGDGRDDIFWRNVQTGQDALWRSGNAQTGQAVSDVSDVTWQVAGVGDFDGNGRADLLWRNASSGSNVIWRDANAQNVLNVSPVGDSSWKVAGTGDFNGDGRDDVLWRNATTGDNVVWRNGDAANGQAVSGVGDLNWSVAGTGDYNGDGRADVLWRNSVVGSSVVWNGGDSASAVSIVGVADPQWSNPDQTGTWLTPAGTYGA